MGLYTFNSTQKIPITLDWAWAFLSDPRNLAEITPPELGFVIRSELPTSVYPGLIIVYQVRPVLRIPLTWVTEIKAVEPPVRFIDEQRVGPYRFWHHEHRLRAIEGGVEMQDRVHYALPFGPMGSLMHALVVRRSLQRIFEFRQSRLMALFGRY